MTPLTLSACRPRCVRRRRCQSSSWPEPPPPGPLFPPEPLLSPPPWPLLSSAPLPGPEFDPLRSSSRVWSSLVTTGEEPTVLPGTDGVELVAPSSSPPRSPPRSSTLVTVEPTEDGTESLVGMVTTVVVGSSEVETAIELDDDEEEDVLSPASRLPTAGAGSSSAERRPKLAAPAAVATASVPTTVPAMTARRLRSMRPTVRRAVPGPTQPEVRDRQRSASCTSCSSRTTTASRRPW
jgi:hypothetical protein